MAAEYHRPNPDEKPNLRVVALAGGVGGAKLAHGLAMALPAENLTIIVNTGDDFTHLGLKICPDLDTVCYTLGGLANPVTGWGRVDESWQVYKNLIRLGGPDWFHIGDQDLATHLERTRRLGEAEKLSAITRDFCAAWGVQPAVLPMTDDPVATWVETKEHGWLAFQNYFVEQQCRPTVKGFRFEGAPAARPAPGVLEAINAADLVIFCPSNPWVSIGPILAVAPLREVIAEKTVVAVSPIVGGQAIKGPAAKMYHELGIEPSALAVAQHYGALLKGLVIDSVDANLTDEVVRLGIEACATQSVMKTAADRRKLAEETLALGQQIRGRHRAL